jgi:hypothetical protein
MNHPRPLPGTPVCACCHGPLVDGAAFLCTSCYAAGQELYRRHSGLSDVVYLGAMGSAWDRTG